MSYRRCYGLRAAQRSQVAARYLAAKASIVIIEPKFEKYIAIKLVKPFKRNLIKKQKSMKN